MRHRHPYPDGDIVLDRGPGRYWLLVDFPLELGVERLWVRTEPGRRDGIVDNTPKSVHYATKGDAVSFSWLDERIVFEANLSGDRAPVRAWADVEAEAAVKVEAEAPPEPSRQLRRTPVGCPHCGAPTSRIPAPPGSVRVTRSCGSCGWTVSY